MEGNHTRPGETEASFRQPVCFCLPACNQVQAARVMLRRHVEFFYGAIRQMAGVLATDGVHPHAVRGGTTSGAKGRGQVIGNDAAHIPGRDVKGLQKPEGKALGAPFSRPGGTAPQEGPSVCIGHYAYRVY